MKFGKYPLSDDLTGGILAHSVRFDGGLFKKGHCLTLADIRTLQNHDIADIMVAIMGEGDVMEDEAAGIIARQIARENITLSKAFTGRVNLFAAQDGIMAINEEGVGALNHLDEAITLATVPQNALVSKGQMIATVKIIPLAVRREVLQHIPGDLLKLHPYRQQTALLIHTELQGTAEKIFKKAKRVTEHRLGQYNITLLDDLKCDHQEQALADRLAEISGGDQDMTLIMGASAITDRRDVIPAAIVKAGGEIIHYGMPVDPGNLMLLAKLKGKWVLGLPGCSRSPKLNGIDLILSRIAAGLDVSSRDIMAMGVGGLLSEYPGRPQPRNLARNRAKIMRQSNRIAALILAAGQSRRMASRMAGRMGEKNKLLLPYQGKTVISHIIHQVKGAGIDHIFAVTGHQKAKLEAEFSAQNVTCFHNDLYDEGMSGSVKLGIASLPDDIDAVLIILGDMPGISASVISKIIAGYNPVEGRSIIIPKHGDKRGNPILWDREFFEDFQQLEGDMGAKILLNQYPEYIHEVESDSEAIFLDIDTIEAYESLKK